MSEIGQQQIMIFQSLCEQCFSFVYQLFYYFGILNVFTLLLFLYIKLFVLPLYSAHFHLKKKRKKTVRCVLANVLFSLKFLFLFYSLKWRIKFPFNFVCTKIVNRIRFYFDVVVKLSPNNIQLDPIYLMIKFN